MEQLFSEIFGLPNLVTKLEDFSLLLPVQVIEELEGHLDLAVWVVELVYRRLQLTVVRHILPQISLHGLDLKLDGRYFATLTLSLIGDFED